MHLKHRKDKEEQEKESSASSKKEGEHITIQRWEAEDRLNNFHYGTSTYYMILKQRSVGVAHTIFDVNCSASKVRTHILTLTNIQAFLKVAKTGHCLADLLEDTLCAH